MMQQASWVSQEVRLDPIFAVAKQVGITRPQFDACYQNQAMIEGLKWVKERGRTLGIIGTPNFFIAGKLVKTTPSMADLRATLDPLLAANGATARRPVQFRAEPSYRKLAQALQDLAAGVRRQR